MSKCWHCEAQNQRDSAYCWACGVSLDRRNAQRRHGTYHADAMRHFSAGTASLVHHRVWLDGIVLVSVILFGLLLGHFFSDTLPRSVPDGDVFAAMRSGPLEMLLPQPKALPVQPVGVAQDVKGIVGQVAQVQRGNTQPGIEAGAGNEVVTALVVIDNQSKKPLVYSLRDWKLRDASGRSVTARGVNEAGWLSSGRVGPGQQVMGWIAFVVPAGTSEVQLSFAPSGLGALLRWDVPAPAQ